MAFHLLFPIFLNEEHIIQRNIPHHLNQKVFPIPYMFYISHFVLLVLQIQSLLQNSVLFVGECKFYSYSYFLEINLIFRKTCIIFFNFHLSLNPLFSNRLLKLPFRASFTKDGTRNFKYRISSSAFSCTLISLLFILVIPRTISLLLA